MDPKKIRLSPATFARTGMDRQIIRTLGEYGQNLAAAPNEIAIKKDGYIETFLVNETNENVWFDQFRIQSTGPLIVQETHGACPDERSDIGNPWGVELSGLGYQYGEDRA